MYNKRMRKLKCKCFIGNFLCMYFFLQSNLLFIKLACLALFYLNHIYTKNEAKDIRYEHFRMSLVDEELWEEEYGKRF